MSSFQGVLIRVSSFQGVLIRVSSFQGVLIRVSSFQGVLIRVSSFQGVLIRGVLHVTPRWSVRLELSWSGDRWDRVDGQMEEGDHHNQAGK